EAGNIVGWNKTAERIFKFNNEEIIGQPLTKIIPQRLREDHRKGFQRYNTTQEAHIIGRIVELSAIRKSGEEFPVELSLSAWTTGGHRFFTAIIRDISEKKKNWEVEK